MSESTGINQSSPKISRLSSQNSLLDWIGSFGSEDIGVDIGTTNIIKKKKHKGLVFPEASVIARNRMSGEYLAYGTRAEEMEGKTPSEIVISRPMKESAIVDYNGTAFLLNSIVNKSYLKGMFFHPRLIMCVPKGINSVQRRALLEAAVAVGARKTVLIDQPLAAVMGMGLENHQQEGTMIVDIGGGTAEVAVISLSGIVASRSVRCAGDALDQSIIAFIKRKYNLLVGERTAEQIKIEIGSACPQDPETSMEIKGRNLVDGLPKDILIRSEEVRDAMNDCLLRIVEAIKDTLECTPPELSSDIIDRGIMLSGGGALLRGLDTLIQNETGIEVHIAESPLDCVALGAGAVLDNPDLAGRRKEEMSYL